MIRSQEIIKNWFTTDILTNKLLFSFQFMLLSKIKFTTKVELTT
jgi:hypothetical protein